MDAKPQFTDQQSAAITTRNVSIALSAGAGCGKTFVLTQRFLAGLEPSSTEGRDVSLHSLVAITFTDRAAREMRDRIRAACHERLRHCPSEAVDHWLEILRGLDSARISTIHSFCTSLLRSQAVEAGLDPSFSVLEPALADTLLRHVVRDTLNGLLELRDPDAVQFVVLYGLERTRDLLRNLTAQRFQIDFRAFAETTPEQLAAAWLRKWRTEVAPKLIRTFRESPLVARVLELISGAPCTRDKMVERIANLATLLPIQIPWEDPLESLTLVRENATVVGGGTEKDWISKERQEQVKEAFTKLRAAIDGLKKDLSFEEGDVTLAAEIACRALRLTEQTANAYAVAKRSQGVLDFDDLLLHARNLLRDHPNVRQRVAAGIRLLMVDEFQDTDPVQADVVRFLCGEAMTRGKLFMVGDRKQSIYRFRRADPTVFATMSAELPAAGRLPLNINFRSQPAVLNFVNQMFASAMEGYEGLQPFREEQYSPTPAIEFLFATFDAAEMDPSANDSVSGASLGDDDLRPKAGELRRREADWIARRISSLLNDPTPRIRTKNRDASGRPLLRRTEPGDIVILFRALSSVQEYESALRKFGIEYYLVGGKAFFAQQEVFDLLNLCRYLDDCDDLIGLMGVLRSPFFNLDDDAIHAIVFRSADDPLTDPRANSDAEGPLPSTSYSRFASSLHTNLYLEPPTHLPESQRERIAFAARILSELRASKDRIPLTDLLNRAIERTGYDASLLAEFLGRRKLANLRKLIEMARQFDKGEFFTLKDFVTRLQTSVLDETDEEFATTLPESGDVVRLMSIHQSKGLEFPVVIVADIDRKGPPRSSDSVLHPDLGPLVTLPQQFGNEPKNLALRMHLLAEEEADSEETIRLFYVACTRAADYLILSAGLDTSKSSHSPWMNVVESRFDIKTGLLKFDALLGASANATADPATIPEVLVHRVPCDAKIAEAVSAREIAVGELPQQVLTAEPAEFPTSARVFGRDTSDAFVTSVSRLEAIDAELNAISHSHGNKRSIDLEGEVVDLDMASALGTLVHSVLERVDFRNVDNWEQLLISAAHHSPDQPHETLIEQARGMLGSFFKSPFHAELARAKSIHREIDFLLPWTPQATQSGAEPSTVTRSTPMIAGIIDLLIETDNGWHVLDYKTGDFPLKAANEKLLAPYELQLGIYAYAVEQWFGVVPQELSLIAFRPQVRRITLPWSAERWQQIRARIDRAIATT
ncbi:UvrD-helicase domain-containing protein [Schlesneria paludicola]|uniref:UvrD-helicase domain-containing protein n=1 Tax=Schlesneria paludicola TaxID=360056 RepID=UPI000299DC69|nr:UvrD-helicase domain-containing protein [Schlesneria paludicola]